MSGQLSKDVPDIEVSDFINIKLNYLHFLIYHRCLLVRKLSVCRKDINRPRMQVEYDIKH